jgi:hypothetical protein
MRLHPTRWARNTVEACQMGNTWIVESPSHTVGLKQEIAHELGYRLEPYPSSSHTVGSEHCRVFA